MRVRSLSVATLLAMLAVVSLGVAPATGETTEPAVTDLAWYWQDANQTDVDTPVGVVTGGTTNPFCPAAPNSIVSPQETCAESRLPIWIRQGDYDEQYMFSAVAFDMSLVPVGSSVKKFTVAFLEDWRECVDHDGQPNTLPRCRETGPIAPDGKKLKACIAEDIIGAAEAAEAEKVPAHSCSAGDPVGKRKEVKQDDDTAEPRYEWTFDLTPFAKEWVSEFSVVTGIIIKGKALKEDAENNDANWRAVLAGPLVDDGITTKITFSPPADEFGGTTTTTGGTTTTTTTDFGSSSSTDFGSSSSTDLGSSSSTDTGTDSDTDSSGDEQPTDDGSFPIATDAAADRQEGFPAYVWLALLAGITGFSLVRSVVLEAAAGIRPNGALAQIRRLNEQRRGTTISAATASRQGPNLVDAIGSSLSKATEKLRTLIRRG